MNPLAPKPRTRLTLLQVRMHLDLMRRGHHFRLLQQPFHFLAREVGDADGFRFPLLECLLHGFPGIDVVGVAVYGFFIRVFGEHVIAPAEGDGPVHEVEVYVVGIEIFEGGVESGFDVVGVVGVIPAEGVRDGYL